MLCETCLKSADCDYRKQLSEMERQLESYNNDSEFFQILVDLSVLKCVMKDK